MLALPAGHAVIPKQALGEDAAERGAQRADRAGDALVKGVHGGANPLRDHLGRDVQAGIAARAQCRHEYAKIRREAIAMPD